MPALHRSIFTHQMLFLTPNQQCEGLKALIFIDVTDTPTQWLTAITDQGSRLLRCSFCISQLQHQDRCAIKTVATIKHRGQLYRWTCRNRHTWDPFQCQTKSAYSTTLQIRTKKSVTYTTVCDYYSCPVHNKNVIFLGAQKPTSTIISGVQEKQFQLTLSPTVP